MCILIELKIPSENNHGSFEFEATWFIAKDLPREHLQASFNDINGRISSWETQGRERFTFFSPPKVKTKLKISDSHRKS